MRNLVRFQTGLLVLFLLSVRLFAQFDTATVLGTVSDTTGGVIANSKVTLENVETGVTNTVTSNENGNYEFGNVRIGTYRVRAEASGFQTAVADTFTVRVNARQRVDLSLPVGQTSESVVVQGAAQQLETESSDRGQVITTQAIVNLPLNGRAYADLALLSPGVRRSNLNNQSITSRDASFNVNGLRSSLNNFMVDGVDNNAYGTSNQGFSNQVVQLNPDAVAEFRVQTNNYSAEYGRAGGAIINATVRSGTNQFHGAAWEFLRNTQLNAVGYFKPRNNVKPTLVQNQFGASLGGPVLKDKAFFFADYEGFRRVTSELTFATVPTADQRAGIFGTPLRNPLTGEVYANGTIPSSAISPYAKGVLADLPLPNRPGNADNYESLPKGTQYDDKGDVRYDHYFSTKLTAFVRYSQREANVFVPPGIPGPSGGNSNGNTNIRNKQLAPGVTYAINSNSVLEFRLGWSRVNAGKTPIGIGLPTAQERFGITGLPTDTRIAGGIPSTSIGGGFTQLGRQTSNPQYQDPTVWNPKVNYSRIMGRHSVKLGYEYQRINTQIDDFNPKYGLDTFSGQFSRPAGTATTSNATLSQAYNLADFLFGARSRYELNNAAIVNYRQRMHFGYVQDDFKVSPKFTLNLGVRYEFATPQWEADNKLANFDPATRTLIQAKSGSLYDRTLINPDKNNWAPRIGLAYTLGTKTVLRSGYGVSYIHFNRMGGENLLAYNGPNIVYSAVDQDPSRLAVCTDASQAAGTCFRPVQLGYPNNFVAPANYSPLLSRVNYIPKDLRTAYVQSWHFTVQQELAKSLVLDVAYVGTRGNGLMILGDYNQARPNAAGENTPLINRRPIAGYDWIQIAFNGGWSTYHALQVKLEKRYSAGLYLLNSFTYSNALDNASGHLETANGDNSRVNYLDLRNEKGVGGYDQPFNNTTSVLYELPYGRGRRWGTDVNQFVNGVLGGWRLTAINTATSGQPVNITYGPASSATVSTAPNYRADYIGGDIYGTGDQTLNYFNKAVFAQPPTTRVFGNVGRNVARSNPFYQLDAGLHKDFRAWSESSRVEFRAEAFNLFNKTNFQPANSTFTSSSFGRITSTFPARQLQFALKLVY